MRKSKARLHALCAELFREQGSAVSSAEGLQVRAFDATTVNGPGKTGSQWAPSLQRQPAFVGLRLLQADRHGGRARASRSGNRLPGAEFPATAVLEYRLRWQVELVFERFKSLAQLGHLPKHNYDSAKAWLYGKLLVTLLEEKLIRHALATSPWRYDLEVSPTAQRVARLPIRSQSSQARHRSRHLAGPGAEANGTRSHDRWPNHLVGD